MEKCIKKNTVHAHNVYIKPIVTYAIKWWNVYHWARYSFMKTSAPIFGRLVSSSPIIWTHFQVLPGYNFKKLIPHWSPNRGVILTNSTPLFWDCSPVDYSTSYVQWGIFRKWSFLFPLPFCNKFLTTPSLQVNQFFIDSSLIFQQIMLNAKLC